MAKPFRTKNPIGTLSEVNIVPLMDLVFNLLIIFMIVAPVIHKGLDVKIPESAVGESSVEPSQHVVTILADGAIWFDDKETSLETLAANLQGLSDVDNVFLQADKAIAYGAVIDVISAIKENGIQHVGLVTKPRIRQTAKK